jgi:hypothetical protein
MAPPTRLKAVIARCRACGAYTDDIEIEYEPAAPAVVQTPKERDRLEGIAMRVVDELEDTCGADFGHAGHNRAIVLVLNALLDVQHRDTDQGDER